MANITITVNEDLRKRMKRARGLNWSEVAREAFELELRRREAREAAEEIDRIRLEDKGKTWSGVREIRKWRNRTR